MSVRYSRQRAIIAQVRGGVMSVGDLAVRLGVSRSTIRRDLGELAGAGVLQRVHGGAAPLEDIAAAEEADRPFEDVADDAADDKQAVARRSAALVRDGDVVLLDIGTTTRALARELAGRSITVVTPSLAVLDELRDDPAVEVVLLGGSLRRRYHSLVGPLTEESLRQIRAHLVFLGTSGVSRSGDVLDTTSIEVPTKRALMASAERIVLMADRTKFPGWGSLRVCGVDALDVLVTSVGADPETLDLVRAGGAEVIEA